MANPPQSNFITALSKIDPTLGFVEYIQATKPYHTKILEVLVEHIYAEPINVTFQESLTWEMFFTTPHVSLLSAIIDPHSIDLPVPGTAGPTAGYQEILFTPSITGATLVNGTSAPITYEIDVQVDGGIVQHITINGVNISDYNSLVSDINAVLTGAVASIVGGNIRITSITTGVLSSVIIVDVNATVYSCTYGNVWNPVLSPFAPDSIIATVLIKSAVNDVVSPNANSFLIQSQPYTPFEMGVASTQSNQFVMSKNYDVTGKNLVLNKWLVADPGNTLVTELTTGTLPKTIFISSDTGLAGNGRYTVTGTPTWAAGTASVQVVETISTLANANGKLHRPLDNTIVFPIVSVTTGAFGQWTIAGDFTSFFTAGKNFVVHSNTGLGVDTTYSVLSSVFGGVNTGITVATIAGGATGDGNIAVISGTLGGELPQWRPGTAVKLSTTGTLPVPTDNTTTYYFQPTTQPGYFNLSTKRYAFEYNDFVELTTLGTGNFFATRDETFIPGTTVDVFGTNLQRNDGKYTVKQITHEAPYERVFVFQRVDSATVGVPPSDGAMKIQASGYANPIYCPPAKATSLHVDTFIHENLKFTFEINLSDYMEMSYEENAPKGFGETAFGDSLYGPFGTFVPAIDPYTAQTSGLPAASTFSGDRHTAHTILPTGIDTQLFDVGGIDETLESVRLFYGQ